VHAIKTTLLIKRSKQSLSITAITVFFLQIVCDPVLLYGLEACALNKSQMASVYFVVNQFFLKLFKTNNIETVKGCQEFFSFELPSE